MNFEETKLVWALTVGNDIVGLYSDEKKALYQMNLCIQAESGCGYLFAQAENTSPVFTFYDNNGNFVCNEVELDLTTSEKVECMEKNLVDHHIRFVKVQREKSNYEYRLTCRVLQ